MLLWLAVASVLASTAFAEPLKAYEHKLVDICGVRDLLEANCNGATYIDTCDMCVHDAVKVACPAIDPPDCIALVKYLLLSRHIRFCFFKIQRWVKLQK